MEERPSLLLWAIARLIAPAVVGASAVCLLTTIPAGAQPTAGGYPDDPVPQCGDVGGGTRFAPVSGDPTAYTRCVNGVPAGIGRCPDGFNFSGQCILQRGAKDTVSVDSISQAAPPDPQCLFCPGPPINVTVTYSGTGFENLNLDGAGIWLSGPRGWAIGNSGDAGIALAADGQRHSIVIPARATGLSGWLLSPGEQVQIDAVLTYTQAGQGDPLAQPLLVGATTSRTLTSPAPTT
jgi:hypothetical protein